MYKSAKIASKFSKKNYLVILASFKNLELGYDKIFIEVGKMGNNNTQVFSNRLKELRKSLSLTQSELARQLGIPTSTYTNWEIGRTEPSIQDIFNLIEFFGIEATDLFDVD